MRRAIHTARLSPVRPFADEIGASPGRLRIALTTVPLTGTPAHPDCLAAARDAADLLTTLGHEVVEAAPALDGEMLWKHFIAVWTGGVTWTVRAMSQILGRTPAEWEIEPITRAYEIMGRKITAADYLAAIQYFQFTARQVAEFMKEYDVLLTPTLASPPLPLGSFSPTPEDPVAGAASAAFTPFTPLSNATGQPSMTVPLFWNGSGMPVGTHFTGRYGDEATLFRLAAQLEQARPWSGRRPAVAS